jgi:hypothetical protein
MGLEIGSSAGSRHEPPKREILYSPSPCPSPRYNLVRKCPSARTVSPVTWPFAAEQRKTVRLATSSGCVSRHVAADRLRGREPGESALAAFGRFVLEPRGVFASEDADPAEATRQLGAITRVITESPALLAREREIFTRYTHALAKLLADETDADPDRLEPYVAAHAMIGVHRSAIDFIRLRTLAVRSTPLGWWSTGPRCGLTDDSSPPCWSVRRIPTHGRLTPCGN